MSEQQKKVLMIDPPSGWRYGFPRVYDFQPSDSGLSPEALRKEREQWFRDHGYPDRLIRDGMLKHCRIFEDETE